MAQEILQKNTFEITLNCSGVLSYGVLQNKTSPIKRLYVKNTSQFDEENIVVRLYSKPDFLLPVEVEQPLLPRRATTKFELDAKLSPLYFVAADKNAEGEIIAEVCREGKVLSEARCPVRLLAFNECNFSEDAAEIAAFVKRSAETNKLFSAAIKKLNSWNVTNKTSGYSGSKNAVRNFFAACFSLLSEQNFIKSTPKTVDGEIITDHKELLASKIATPLELALLFASVIEADGLNALIGKAGGKWYVGCFLSDECFSDVVTDDGGLIARKVENGVNDVSVIDVNDVFSGVAFEKAEKSAAQALKKCDGIDFFVDIKRARIMRIYPLPQRVKKEGGFDLQQSKDYITGKAPKQISEYQGDIGGTKEISRVTQWERKLLDMDMRNALLNFKITQTATKLLVPSLEDMFGAVAENGIYQLEAAPKDAVVSTDKYKSGFDNADFFKPFTDYALYEYKSKRLRTVLDIKNHESTLLKLYRKEKSIQEETGTDTLYLAAGFLKWRENESYDFKFAPLFLYPAALSKKGIASTQYILTINSEEARINSTLLEFLYRQFNLDMRGLQSVTLADAKAFMAVLARIKRETVNFKGWEVSENVYLSNLSFANYLLWYDVRNKADKFKNHPVISSLIDNRLELDTSKYEMSNRSSDEAYVGKEKMYLPISADSSQYSAIYDSLSKSFVLHGPPGTGKSQTITNIIANNVVRGRRVLFVAEKMAALSVVHKRLNSIGIGDFCLELYSDKTDKIAVLEHILKTLSLADGAPAPDIPDKIEEITACIDKLQKELDALHKKRYLGFSLYKAVLGWFENKDAPDCLRIDNIFYEKLTETSFNKYLDLLTELALRAKECGDIDKSPFKHIGRFDYSDLWRKKAETVLEIYLTELKHLRLYAHNMLPLFNIRTVSLTTTRIDAMNSISRGLANEQVAAFFRNRKEAENPKGLLDSFIEAKKKNDVLMREYTSKFGAYPANVPINDIIDAAKTGSLSRSLKKILPDTAKADKQNYLEFLLKCEQNREILNKRTTELAALFYLPADADKVSASAEFTSALYTSAAKLYAEFNSAIFEDCCGSLVADGGNLYLNYFAAAYDTASRAKSAFNGTFFTDGYAGGNDINGIIDYVANIQRNTDYIPSWCKYQEIVEKCRKNGFEFVLEPLGAGEITADDILRCFKKCVYFNFIRSELYLDDALCQFSGLTLEETSNKFKGLSEEYERLTREVLYNKLVESLPRTDTPGDHNLERVILMRAEKTNMKGTTLRNLFLDIPNILKATCPCMLMSPTSVAQFLDIDMDKFDLVVFDEASQVPTCEAVGCIARGKDVIVVGDPKQLPPTTFFAGDYKDDEHYDSEDLDSILDDCLALGLPENHLLWHYRSCHESLIAFSNAMFYDNTLLTFPSPNELSSKVSFRYVDGVYERGGTKRNKKEADELIKEVISRLKDPTKRSQSIGIVTFNTAQQNYIENELTRQVHQNNLDAVAYDVDEPIFVKNLENVQGDERDVILFSVGYGPDAAGKLSLNFGPINQSGGYKRLNVAVTRARSEMRVFSAITGNMIDLARTDSKGVAGLKAFLEYAEHGRDMLAIDSSDVSEKTKCIGALVAADLKDRGIMCDYNVGVSDFKIDVAIIDPKNKDKYILAILSDSENECRLGGVKDRVAMQTKVLKKLGWNTYTLWTINYFNNPRREIQKIKDYITALTEKKVLNKKMVADITKRYRETYKNYYCKPMTKAGAEYVMNFVNEEKINEKIRTIIETESPIEEKALVDKLCLLYNVAKTQKRAVQQLNNYVAEFQSFRSEYDGKVFYADKPVTTFRPNDTRVKRDLTKIHPDEILAAAICAVETRLNLTTDDIAKETALLFGLSKRTKAQSDYIQKIVDSAVASGRLILTVDNILTT